MWVAWFECLYGCWGSRSQDIGARILFAQSCCSCALYGISVAISWTFDWFTVKVMVPSQFVVGGGDIWWL